MCQRLLSVMPQPLSRKFKLERDTAYYVFLWIVGKYSEIFNYGVNLLIYIKYNRKFRTMVGLDLWTEKQLHFMFLQSVLFEIVDIEYMCGYWIKILSLISGYYGTSNSTLPSSSILCTCISDLPVAQETIILLVFLSQNYCALKVFVTSQSP